MQRSHRVGIGEAMTPERYSQVKSLFNAAQEIETEHRAAFLAENCNGDGELQNAVAELLASSAKAERFIEKAAYEVLSETLVADAPTISVAGKRIGPYEIVREIDHGGMGTVYLARRDDDVYQKQVAIKIVRGGFESQELRRRFYDERRILARLDHPNITKLLDGGTTDEGLPYYVMDYVEGVALNQYCEQNDLSINERLELFRQVCAAVQYAHRNLVIHRDLKPSNILVAAEGVPRLLDFGIAKVFQDEENPEATRTNMHVMTPEYASPEQVGGKVVTTASDIYSLGVILYELLTGSRPFHFTTNSLEEIIRAVCETAPPKPSDAGNERRRETRAREKSVSGKEESDHQFEQQIFPSPNRRIHAVQLKGDLDNIVLKALSKEPERRYSSVEQFSEDIRRHLEGLPVSARPDTFRYRSSKFIRRHKIGVAVAAGVLLFLIAGAIAIVRQTRIAAQAARLAAEQRDKAQREQAKAERINKFFQEMLGFANPSWYAPGFNKSGDVTVAQALEEAARKIENDLNEEPEVKAEILLTIGETYASIGKFEPSERALESAVQLRRQAHGDASVKFADVLYFLANTKRGLGKREEMLRLYEQAHSIYVRRAGEDAPQFPYFLLDYAGTFSIKGNHAEAVRLTKEAIQKLRELKGENHHAVAVARENLATAYYMWGDMDNALAEAQAASEITKPLTSTLQRLGQIHFARGELDQAEPVLLEVASRLEKENSSSMQSNALLMLANLYQARSDHRKAEEVMERVITIDRRLYAPHHSTLLNHIVAHGMILVRAGKIRQGEKLIRAALGQMTADERLGYDSSLGELLLAQKRYAEAEPLLLNHYRSLEGTQHPASPRLKTARERLETITNVKNRN